jgi:hypothetical protein
MEEYTETENGNSQINYRIILAHQRRVLKLYDSKNELLRKEKLSNAHKRDYQLFGSSSQKITLIQDFQDEISFFRSYFPNLEKSNPLVRERLKTLQNSLDKLEKESRDWMLLAGVPPFNLHSFISSS